MHLKVLCVGAFALILGVFSAAVAPPITSFSGGHFEASGVVQVPGTYGVLFVDDGRTDEIFWMRLSEDRKQAGAIDRIKLSASIIDLEGITTDGKHFYVVGSQSKSKGGDLTGLARFRFEPNGKQAADTQAIAGLKNFLADNVAELRGMHQRKYSDGGINVEGIAWDPARQRLLLGLRSPVVNGEALIVPLRLRDPQGAFTFDNLQVQGQQAVRLPLGGAGIRSIEYDEQRATFHLITGAGPNAENMDFKLWEWSGDGEPPTLRETDTFDRRLKPEGITRVSSGDQSFIFIVFDTSRYAAQD